MDELVIDDKKYLSSKRAAKITGYAKDYVGQLCREGRVAARLVGRSWYVLESAIRDHRFGTPKETPGAKKEDAPRAFPPETWETPRYEASTGDILPALSRREEPKADIVFEKRGRPEEVPDSSPENLQEAWREWFSRIGGARGEQAPIRAEESEKSPEEAKAPLEESAEEVAVPIRAIHAVYEPPPREFLPPSQGFDLPGAVEYRSQRPRREGSTSKRFVRALQVIGVLLALFSAFTAVVGSGYFDSYIISLGKSQSFAGVFFYNK